VREQIVKNGILEKSFYDYVNPLTVVERPGKGIRICTDARRINTLMVPDRVKVDPMKELLDSMDLSILQPWISAVLSFRFHYTHPLGNGPVFSLAIM
jgi:hypothetical protein